MAVATLNELGTFMTQGHVYRPLPSPPVVSETYLTPGMGTLGEEKIRTPSGRVVKLSPEEEEEIAREALRWSLMQDIRGPEEMKSEAIKAALGAVGTALGFAIGGMILKNILGVKDESK